MLNMNNIADIAYINPFAVYFRILLFTLDKTAVNTADTDCTTAVCIKKCDNFFICFTYKYLLSSLHCDIVRHTQTVYEFTLYTAFVKSL